MRLIIQNNIDVLRHDNVRNLSCRHRLTLSGWSCVFSLITLSIHCLNWYLYFNDFPKRYKRLRYLLRGQPFLSRINNGTCNVVLTFESVEEMLWCDHSNETLQQYFCMVPFVFQYSTKRNFRIFLEFWYLVQSWDERVNIYVPRSSFKIFNESQWRRVRHVNDDSWQTLFPKGDKIPIKQKQTSFCNTSRNKANSTIWQYC